MRWSGLLFTVGFGMCTFLLPLAVGAQTTTTAATTTAPTTLPATSTRTERTFQNYSADDTYERAIVRDVRSATEATPDGGTLKQAYSVEFLSGPLRGQTKILSSDVISNPYQLEPRPGDRVVILLQPNPEGGEPLAYIEGFDRLGAILWLVALFVLTLVLLSGWQGVKTAFSILLSVALIGWILIPAFLRGVNPVPIAIFLAVVLTTITSVLSMGWNKKAWVTIVGTLGGVLVAYIISVIFGDWAHLGGMSSDEDRLFFEKNPLLNPQGLLFSGIIIAAMGVVEDVAVSISSGVLEVQRANSHATLKALFRSGMIIGRDHMSALANTLIFAYVGASLSTLLLYTQYGGSWLKFLNFDVVADEIVRSLSGSIGLVFTVPITALLAALACIKLPRPPAS
ncbi:YibE/F family protein [Candidatus Uhrbacteria bacterium]|nr:YibE/F family protein [Candidatus Uhrbacteria bacterium]